MVERVAVAVQDCEHALELALADVGVNDGRQLLEGQQEHRLHPLQQGVQEGRGG